MTPVVPPVKTCPACSKTKSSREFYGNAGRVDGLSTYCAECTTDYNKNRGAYQRAYHKNFKQSKEQTHQWYKDNPIKWRILEFARKYNITMEWYEEKLKEQGGLCAICRRPQSAKKGTPRWLAIDHDHACCPKAGRSCGECVRGLLCTSCNTKLCALEMEQWREAADDYLRRYKQRAESG